MPRAPLAGLKIGADTHLLAMSGLPSLPAAVFKQCGDMAVLQWSDLGLEKGGRKGFLPVLDVPDGAVPLLSLTTPPCRAATRAHHLLRC